MASVRNTHTTILSTKGQVILPKPIRNGRDWQAGARLIVEDTPDGVLLKPEPLFAPTTIETVFGVLYYDGPPQSIEDIDAAIAAEARQPVP